MKKLNLITVTLTALLIIFIGFNTSVYASSNWPSKTGKQLTQKEKLDDFKYMYKILKENYPFLYPD